MDKYKGHTPEPWKVIIDDSGYVYVVGPNHTVEKDPADGELLHYGTICYIGDMEDTDQEDFANSELLADAWMLPKMISAIRAAIPMIKELIQAQVLPPDDMSDRIVLDMLESALGEGDED